MILTGKCREDFLRYYGDEISHLDEIEYDFLLDSSIIRNAYYVDFFDSVGIYINIENLYYQSWWSYKVKIIPNIFEEKVMVKTRQEATEQAIKKANEIYNNKN